MPITRTSNLVYRYESDGRTILIERIPIGTAYARNGNVHNPTRYYKWGASVDGRFIGSFALRADAYEAATGHRYCAPDGRVMGSGKPVRNYLLVKGEMRANYRGRTQS